MAVGAMAEYPKWVLVPAYLNFACFFVLAFENSVTISRSAQFSTDHHSLSVCYIWP